jgi:hypothetical protein
MVVENEMLELFSTCSIIVQDSKRWLLDLRCTHYMTPHKKWFYEYTPLTKLHAVYMGDERINQVVGVGTIIIWMYFS